MDQKLKAIVFLVLIPFVVTFFVLSSLYLHIDKLPDPYNVLGILTFAFLPPFLMLLYWIDKYYLVMKSTKEVGG